MKYVRNLILAMYIVELSDIPQKNRKEGIFVILELKLSKKFYTGKPTYHKNTSIPSKY